MILIVQMIIVSIGLNLFEYVQPKNYRAFEHYLHTKFYM
jgi:hypothetical protein